MGSFLPFTRYIRALQNGRSRYKTAGVANPERWLAITSQAARPRPDPMLIISRAGQHEFPSVLVIKASSAEFSEQARIDLDPGLEMEAAHFNTIPNGESTLPLKFQWQMDGLVLAIGNGLTAQSLVHRSIEAGPAQLLLKLHPMKGGHSCHEQSKLA